ncbi:hypothetical protein DOTSEDRAFT_71185 [Dothistroma septosporum NZE10]|uniref:Zn(2)-C6 fungal-type domain-containing protein n=1 Tax=Dothistroma septosporum (strain NZE10 / CBS 128990) TaxID=675120 RepID=N1PPL5_DOTSN|nr:hypothetical protein DOTSEDRAFT_71185 [Dothistroma septosporum NZE10]
MMTDALEIRSPTSLLAPSGRRSSTRTTDKASGSGSPDSPEEGDSSSHGRKVTDVACWPCRKRKGKCTGERPICQSCVRRGYECAYEYDEGLTRVGSLRMRLTEASTRAENLEYLFDHMRTRSDNEAAMLLAIIRLGADLDAIVTRLKSEDDLTWTTAIDPTAADLSGLKST